MNIKKIGFLILCLGLCMGARAQWIGVRTNVAAWACLTPNVGVEVAFGEKSRSDFFNKLTLAVDGAYSPFVLSDGRQTKMWAVQPEFRYYFDYKMTGHFMGLYGEYSEYDYGLWKYRYKGTLYGGGLSYGYVWQLGRSWNVEANIGLGVTRLLYDNKYDRQNDMIVYPPESHTKFGISRAGIGFTYFFR